MKNRKNFWIPLIIILVMEVYFCFQLAGYLLALRQNSDKNYGGLHAALLVHHFREFRHQLGSDALNYVRTKDPIYRQKYRENLAMLDMLDSARYKPAGETWTGFYLNDFIEDDPTNSLLRIASNARFHPAEAELLNRIIQIIHELADIEQSAMDQVATDGVSLGNILSEGLGPSSEDYQKRVIEADSQLDTLHGMMEMSHDCLYHETFDDVYWLLSLGIIRATLLLGSVWLVGVHLSQLNYRALHDSLTGLPNRRYVELHLKEVCSRAQVHGDLVILAFIDLNGFKLINDTLGHEKGDSALKYIAESLRVNCRSGDMAFRYGGDEFVVVFISPANRGCQSLERLKNLIRSAFSEPSQFNEARGFGAAVGISVFPWCAKTSDMLIKTADDAMYRAKGLVKDENESLAIVECDRDFARRDNYGEG